jgi:hypothetical protein
MSDEVDYNKLRSLINRLQGDYRRYSLIAKHRNMTEGELRYYACLCEALVSIGASVENFYKNTELP